MNAPADDEQEYIQRMARLRRPPERHHVSFAFPARNPSLDTLSAGSQQHGPSDVELLSVPHENPSFQLASAPVNAPAANHFIVKEIEMPPSVSATTGRSPASSPILVPTPTDLPVNLKRKESPTKLAKPARKKASSRCTARKFFSGTEACSEKAQVSHQATAADQRKNPRRPRSYYRRLVFISHRRAQLFGPGVSLRASGNLHPASETTRSRA
ncbi:hypothetical protein C8F01DRAFT_481342 [Mycena amicta]|nr:hypothetical protein C8F01DRAFT_481342 [Mycena amicta]